MTQHSQTNTQLPDWQAEAMYEAYRKAKLKRMFWHAFWRAYFA